MQDLSEKKFCGSSAFKQLLFRPIETQGFIVAACNVLMYPSVINTIVLLDEDLSIEICQVMIFKP